MSGGGRGDEVDVGDDDVERDSDDATIGYDADGYNVSLGLDYRFSEALVWGGALGLGNDELEFGRNLGKQESDRREDFSECFDFEESLVIPFIPKRKVASQAALKSARVAS